MNITLYINKRNEERFGQEEEKSKLVNKLLDGYYEGIEVRQVTKATSASSEPYVFHKSPAKGPSIPPNLERGCCLNAKPCQHWSFDGESWVNSLSGRKRDTE